jgi:hypothetical protein
MQAIFLLLHNGKTTEVPTVEIYSRLVYDLPLHLSLVLILKLLMGITYQGSFTTIPLIKSWLSTNLGYYGAESGKYIYDFSILVPNIKTLAIFRTIF